MRNVLISAGFLLLTFLLVEQLNAQRASGIVFGEWLRLIEEKDLREDIAKLSEVNRFFNDRLHFSDDKSIWGQDDYWATPRETMNRGSGDCEDFVIAKFVTLLNMDIPQEKLRLIYVRASIGGAQSGISQAHMVLGFFPSESAEPLILDNLIAEVRPASSRPDLTPIFSFNTQGLWTRGTKSVAEPSTKLSRWRSVLHRMSQDGTPLFSPSETTTYRGN